MVAEFFQLSGVSIVTGKFSHIPKLTRKTVGG